MKCFVSLINPLRSSVLNSRSFGTVILIKSVNSIYYVLIRFCITHLVSDNSMTMILSLHGTEHQTMLSVNDRIQYYVKVACYEMRSFLDVGHSRYIIL